MEVMFGRRYQEVIAEAFLETGHDTSYENVTFAEADNAVVGMTLAYSEAQHRLSILAQVIQIQVVQGKFLVFPRINLDGYDTLRR